VATIQSEFAWIKGISVPALESLEVIDFTTESDHLSDLAGACYTVCFVTVLCLRRCNRDSHAHDITDDLDGSYLWVWKFHLRVERFRVRVGWLRTRVGSFTRGLIASHTSG
jgi:hypothetical protein